MEITILKLISNPKKLVVTGLVAAGALAAAIGLTSCHTPADPAPSCFWQCPEGEWAFPLLDPELTKLRHERFYTEMRGCCEENGGDWLPVNASVANAGICEFPADADQSCAGTLRSALDADLQDDDLWTVSCFTRDGERTVDPTYACFGTAAD